MNEESYLKTISVFLIINMLLTFGLVVSLDYKSKVIKDELADVESKLNLTLSGKVECVENEEKFYFWIPSGETIDEFCQMHDYEMGWLSSITCGQNEVLCSKTVSGAVINDCLRMSLPDSGKVEVLE